MKIDALKQYAKLRQQLLEEKSQLETRLNEINQVLGNETTPAVTTTTTTVPEASLATAQAKRRGRRGAGPRHGNTMSMREAVMQVLSKGPLSRKELVGAVQGVGYVFTTKNPANSLGSVLYAKNTPIKNKEGKFYLPGDAQIEASEANGSGKPPAKKRRKRSPEVRARMAEAAKASWAKRRKAA